MKNINRDKDFLMFSGVVFFIILIGFLWFLSIGNNFQIIKSQSKSNSFANNDMNYISKQINDNMAKMNSQFEKINKILEDKRKNSDVNNENKKLFNIKEASSTSDITNNK